VKNVTRVESESPKTVTRIESLTRVTMSLRCIEPGSVLMGCYGRFGNLFSPKQPDLVPKKSNSSFKTYI